MGCMLFAIKTVELIDCRTDELQTDQKGAALVPIAIGSKHAGLDTNHDTCECI